jgi:hypothetical protein
MSTNSSIAVIGKDGSVVQIFCHWDGDIKRNGKLLFENYNTQEKAEELVLAGNLLSLGTTLEECKHEFSYTYYNHFKDYDSYYKTFLEEDFDDEFNYYFDEHGIWNVRTKGEKNFMWLEWELIPDSDFNYDLEDMVIAINSDTVEVPVFNDFDEFDSWIKE